MENQTISIKTSINKDISTVWDFYNNPEHIVNWNFASNDWCCPKAKNDLKIGGKLQSRMEAKNGSFGFDFEAIYDEVHDFEKIKYTMTDGRSVVINFKKENDTTNVTITFEAESINAIDIQKNGWQAILNNFKAYTESKKIMTEKEKMLAGEMYSPSDPVLMKERHKVRLLFHKFNSLSETHLEERQKVLYQIIENAGENLFVEPPFHCDYGSNIKAGKNLFMNFNCCILDVAEVTIGDNCMFAPHVQIYTATHPLEFKARNSGKELAKPIKIGNNVWIGGNAIICPGVTLGNNVVVAAGAVVTKSFPDDVVVAGNPAKIIKTIDNH